MSGAQAPCLLDVCWSVARPDWAPVDEQIQAWVLAAMVAGANAALPAQGVEVSLLFTNVSDIQRLNGEYRQIDKATNVLSFPAQTLVEDGRMLVGDVVICLSIVEAEAAAQGKLPLVHLTHLVLHGVLHLLGHDHVEDADADQMESIEINLMASLGYANPYAVAVGNNSEESKRT
tara:strand:- start:407 stop:931 length:525 start_codon:yes stop_codon:yes gene_type:complete